jgi:hypothetical protein
MAASFVLIHSPSVDPRTWRPVAHRLTELGWQAPVPSLLHITDQGPPYWPRVVDAVRAGLATAEQGQAWCWSPTATPGCSSPSSPPLCPARC